MATSGRALLLHTHATSSRSQKHLLTPTLRGLSINPTEPEGLLGTRGLGQRCRLWGFWRKLWPKRKQEVGDLSHPQFSEEDMASS